MMTIYKYELAIVDEQTLSLPADAEILSIQEQGGVVCAWVSLDTSKPERDREIFAVGTGNPIDTKGLRHISTVQSRHFVWHFFEYQDADLSFAQF